MAEGTPASGMVEKLKAGLSVSDYLDQAQTFQACGDNEQAINYYMKVIVFSFNILSNCITLHLHKYIA